MDNNKNFYKNLLILKIAQIANPEIFARVKNKFNYKKKKKIL